MPVQILVQISNTPDAPEFDPAQTIGDFECRELCDAQSGCGSPPNCYYDQDPANVDAFVTFVRECICSITPQDITITQQPVGPQNPVSQGSNVTLSVSATTTFGLLLYQWQKDGIDIASASGPTLQLTNLDVCDAGVYRVVVRTQCDTEISDEVFVEVDLNGAVDCDGSLIADECEFAPLPAFIGTIEQDDGGAGDFGNGLTADGAGNVAYTGYVAQNAFFQMTDFDPTVGLDVRELLPFNSVRAITTLFSDQTASFEYEWTNLIDSTQSGPQGFAGSAFPKAVAVDSAANFYITGSYLGDVDFDPGAGTDIRSSGITEDGFVTSFASDQS